jgi:hypothetical protein
MIIFSSKAKEPMKIGLSIIMCKLRGEDLSRDKIETASSCSDPIEETSQVFMDISASIPRQAIASKKIVTKV